MEIIDYIYFKVKNKNYESATSIVKSKKSTKKDKKGCWSRNCVRTPMPGPISNTDAFGVRTASAIRRAMSSFFRKC